MTMGDAPLPPGWSLLRLDDVAITQLGKTINPREAALSPKSSYLRSANVQWGRFELEDVSEMYFSAVEKDKFALERGDLLVCEGGDVGRAAIWGGEQTNIYFQNALHRLRPREGRVTSEWLFHMFRYMSATGVIARFARGNTIMHLSQGSLRQLPAPTPPVPDQTILVERLTAIDDSAAAAASALIRTGASVAKFRRRILADAVSGDLTADWREECQPAAVESAPSLSAQGCRHSSGAPNTDDVVTLPATWAWWPLEAITERVIDYRGRTPPSDGSGSIPHVRTTQIRQGKIEWATDRFVTQGVYDTYMTRGIPRRNDVLFTMEAPMGEVGLVDRDDPFSLAQRILLMRPREDVDGAYLALALQAPAVQRAIEFRATGTGVLGIAYKRLRSVSLPKPSLEEQLEIVRRVERLLDLAVAVEQRVDEAQTAVDGCAQTALEMVFRGDLPGFRAHV